MNSIPSIHGLWYRPLVGCALVLFVSWSVARGQSCFEASENSHLTVSGSASIRSFSCVSSEIQGRAEMNPSSGDSVAVELRVPVRSFSCGRSAMNRDLYEALKADEHPFIQYRVHRAHLIESARSTQRPIRLIGALTMAGTTREDTTVIYRRPARGESIQVHGSTPLSLRRFGVTPPTALFGLIQVQDSVMVSVDLESTQCSAGN